MSKLIVEMEMPECCDDCSAQYDCMACAITGSRWYGKSEFNPSKGRLPDCPIKGVLPEEHGDLIDKDEVKNEMLKRMPMLCMTASGDNPVVCTRQEMLYQISHAKAIFPAERKD